MNFCIVHVNDRKQSGFEASGARLVMDARTLVSEIAGGAVSPAADANLNDVDGWDSLKNVRLVLRLEEIAGRPLSEEEIAGLLNVRDVAAIIKSNDVAR